jgi:ApaG protein
VPQDAARMALALTRSAVMDAPMTKVQTTTRLITVKAEAVYVPERSSALKSHYFFAYRIEIENDGEVPVRLMNRHWVITDGHGEVQEVHGAGVIGSQPLISPGDKFAYTSACPLPTPVGTMSGRYEMEVEGGESFEAEIPAFTLAMPYSLN